ncbi:COG1835 Predicted acyltransferases [Candidatus Nanopelagicaceae bacterium]
MSLAFVVMSGHLIHIKGAEKGFLQNSHLSDILSSGGFAVNVFFGLSGIALRYQTDKYGINGNWFISRLIRLMPVYWITLIPPIAICFFIGIETEYQDYAYLLSIFGLQAISSEISHPPVNGPLWSLSVEIFLSASLLMFGRNRRMLKRYFLLSFVLGALLFSDNLIITALPIFYTGFLLPDCKFINSKNKMFRLVVICLPVFVMILVPQFLQGKFTGVFNFIFCYTISVSILISCMIFQKNTANKISNFSQRSYSLYAVHVPVIIFVDQFFFSSRTYFSALQFAISVSFILAFTEVIYRIFETPSISFSRKRLNKVDL